MLQSGAPFVLSPQTINMLQGGDTNIYETAHYGGAGGMAGGATGGAPGAHGAGVVQPSYAAMTGAGVPGGGGVHGAAGGATGGGN